MESLTFQNLTFAYPEQPEPALREVSLTIPGGAFAVLCGPSGCGKTTLLRHTKPAVAPAGSGLGAVLLDGVPLESLSVRELASRVGYLAQSPEDQLVTDKVWHELAFGLESLGLDNAAIRRRVAETASFFGIQNWFRMDVAELSGGQKQLLNLASVMAMQPELLVLDEPTSQLDPIAARDFLAALERLNRELGVTILMTEQRLEEVLPAADLAVLLDGGRVRYCGTPRELGAVLRDADGGMLAAMPTALRVWAAADGTGEAPVTVREGQDWLRRFAAAHPLCPLPPEPERPAAGPELLCMEDVWFRYRPEGPDVVRGLDLEIRKGEIVAVLGGNGAGKSTALALMGGVLKPQRGSVLCRGRAALLPQEPRTLFVKKTVWEELLEMDDGSSTEWEEQAMETAALCRITHLLDRHPYDLSGGEQQRAALAKLLLCRPELLLLDEPTKGMDAAFKAAFAALLETLAARGAAVCLVSHDAEFCAQYAHRCAMFFDGSITAEGTPRTFFSENNFYTTAAGRMGRTLAPGAVTAAYLIGVCGAALPERAEQTAAEPSAVRLPEPPAKLPLARRLLTAVAAAAALLSFFRAASLTDLTALARGEAPVGTQTWILYGVFLASLLVMALAMGRRGGSPVRALPASRSPGAARARIIAVAVMLVLVPVTLYLGLFRFGTRRYGFLSLVVLLECMLPFFVLFERRRPQARELVLLAVLCAAGVAGRALFFMLPEVKPVMAIVILAGVAFGGETGFLVGAITMLVSNMLMAQGPWTPYQMFAMGLVGLLAGGLFGPGRLRRSRGILCVFSVLAAVVLYGGIMNPVGVLLFTPEVTREALLAAYITGLPMDCIQAASTAVFLFLAADPVLERLDRVRRKYGLLE